MKTKGSRHAGGQLFGYSLQTTRAVVHLLQAERGSFVSVETFEDVGVDHKDGHKTAEQTKSTGTRNPIADYSPELWKTLANWVDAALAGELVPEQTAFHLHLSARRDGQFAKAFSEATDDMSALTALAKAKERFWGRAPKYEKRSRVAGTLAPFLDRVFAADEALVASIIQRFSLSFGRGNANAEIEGRLATFVSSEMLPTVVVQMLGWTKSAIDKLLEQGKPAVVAVDDFAKELQAFLQKYDRRKILYSFAPDPPPDRAVAELPARTYVRQLDIIEADYDTKLRAANDFLRASMDRSIWAEKGLVHPSSFDSFEDDLKRTWSAKKMAVAVQARGRPAADEGRLLYAECIMVKQDLELLAVPSHFTPGCFHALADGLLLGWHPEYRTELAKVPRDVGSEVA